MKYAGFSILPLLLNPLPPDIFVEQIEMAQTID